MRDAERQATLDAIGAEVAACTRCRLHEGRTRAVPGEGTAATEVVFVGEGPGFNEDRQGRPFVGQAGSLLDELLASVLWSRDEVFITNVVKCRPPGNRDPEPDEIAACAPHLTRQLEVLDPALVVTLGRFSMARFSPGARIGQVHGTFRAADAASGAPNALTFAMYHPAAALHQGSLKQTLFADMQGVPRALTEARALRAGDRAPEEPSATIVTVPSPVAADPPAVTPDPEAAPDTTADAGVEFNPTAQLGLF
jgi:DNA polymerase